MKQSKNKRLSQEMSLLLIRPLERFLKQEEVLLELQIMTLWALRLDLSTALKDRSKRENRLFTLLLFIKSMLLTQDLKAFWPSSQEPLDKLLNKSENKSIRKYQNGDKKEKLKSCLEFCSSIKFIC